MNDEPLLLGLREPHSLQSLPLAQWDRLLRMARRTNLLGKVAVAVEDSFGVAALPAPVQPHIVAGLRVAQHQRQAIAWECRHLRTALRSLQVPVILLKGAAYAMADRRAAHGRLFGDVDILVPRGALAATEAALMLAGWATGKEDPYDQRYYRQWMHELPPMVHQQRGTIVDVHHNILPITAASAPDVDKLIAAHEPLPDGSGLSVLAPCDMVIHSAVHLFHEGELRNGLRDLLDLEALMSESSSHDAGFHERLVDRAEELALLWPVMLALRYCRLVLRTPLPESTVARAERLVSWPKARLAWLDGLYLRALAPDHPLLSSADTTLARAMLEVRGHALRMPLPRLALHLGRKAILRLFKHTSRSGA
ncbi:MAG TPA: nucleotidyltransferase family protein [Aquabacterium sp.]|nr:nucleotidyltransferase family protein [Aquabacterium sp.]